MADAGVPAPVVSSPSASAAVAGFNAAAATPIAPTTSPKQAMLVTSTPARTATATNATKLQAITAAPPTPPPPPGSSPSAGGSSVPVAPNTPPVPQASNTPTGGMLPGSSVENQGKPGYDVFGNPLGSATPGTTPGSTSTADPYDAAVKGISDPTIATQYKDTLRNLDSQISTAQTNLANAQALALNDPAATAMIAGIKAKYDQMIQIMKDKNTQFLGKVSSSVSAFGGLGPMSQDFLNNEQQRADQRVSDIQAKEQDAVIRAQIAYQTGDAKALNLAMTEYDKVNKDKLAALNDLLTASNKQVSQQQAQQRIDLAATKQTTTLDISKSANLGAAIAKNISESGITDESQIKDYVAQLAQEYGITNPDILMSAVTKAQQTAQKASDTSANVADTIANRDKGTVIKQQNANTSAFRASTAANKAKTPKTGSFNASTAVSKITPQMEAVKGEDNYIDPAKWIAGRKNWMSLGGTEASYKSNFIHYLNPASYKQAGYKAPAAAGTTYTVN